VTAERCWKSLCRAAKSFTAQEIDFRRWKAIPKAGSLAAALEIVFPTPEVSLLFWKMTSKAGSPAASLETHFQLGKSHCCLGKRLPMSEVPRLR